MKIELSDIADALERAKKGDEILSKMMSYYNIYSGQFDKVPDYECDLCNHYSLNALVRSYIDFDDSE